MTSRQPSARMLTKREGLGKRQIRFRSAVEELTSREKSGTDIPKILERLEIRFRQGAGEAQREAADRKAGQQQATSSI